MHTVGKGSNPELLVLTADGHDVNIRLVNPDTT